MADEDKLKVHSLPPPPTDEIDEDWGSSGAAAPPPAKKDEAKSTARSEADKGTASKKKVAPRDEEEDDEEDDDEEDDDEEDDDEEDDDDEEGDGDDDDDDDEDDDDDDDDDDRRDTRSRRGSSPAKGTFDDLIPDWLPFATLGGLLLFGFLGGIGVIPIDCNLKPAVASATAPTASPPATTTATTRPTTARTARPTGSARPEDGEMVAASHLLVAYKGSARAQPSVTRTKEEAEKRAKQAAARAKKGDEFEKLVAEYSDEPMAAQRGGRLGKFARGNMVPEFSDAAFKLKVGQVSGVVETKFGYHVIKRTE